MKKLLTALSWDDAKLRLSVLRPRAKVTSFRVRGEWAVDPAAGGVLKPGESLLLEGDWRRPLQRAYMSADRPAVVSLAAAVRASRVI